MNRILVATCLGGLALTACGLSLEGERATSQDDAGASFDASSLDDATTGETDGAVVSEASPSGDDAGADDAGEDRAIPDAAPVCDPQPVGWARVGLADRAKPCPAGTTQADVIESPTPNVGACACPGTCSAATHQSCATGNLVTFYDSTGTAKCDQNGLPLQNAPAGACDDQGSYGLGSHFRGTPPPPTGTATCTAPGTADKGHVATGPLRTCAPPAPDSCAAVAFGDCVAMAGDHACPAGPYSKKHVVGGDFTLACAACGCNVTTTCKGSVDMSASSDCSSPVTVAVDDQCHAVPNTGTLHFSKYTGTIDKETCTVSGGPPAPTVALTSAQTVCCK